MTEKFYAVIKLITGEEILTQIKKLNGEYEGYFILYSPIEVNEISIPGIMSGLKIDRWLKISGQETFLLHKDKILTLSELDKTVKFFYLKSLDKLRLEELEQVEASKAIQEIISIEEMRSKLEQLYDNY